MCCDLYDFDKGNVEKSMTVVVEPNRAYSWPDDSYIHCY